MDFSKYPLERFSYFIAGIVPGFAALLVFYLHSPASFGWFISAGYLGYRTKIVLVLVVAFLIGNSLTAFLSSFLGAIGGAYGGVVGTRPYKSPPSYAVAPWRDARWRYVVKKRLGAQAPKDTKFISQELFDLKCKGVDLLPEQQRFDALLALRSEKMSTDMDDWEWAQWYEHYHHLVLQLKDPDPAARVWQGLGFSLQTAALYFLISAIFVPSFRVWWCILPSSVWVVILVAQQYTAVARWGNQWSTLSDQIKFLDLGDKATPDTPDGTYDAPGETTV